MSQDSIKFAGTYFLYKICNKHVVHSCGYRHLQFRWSNIIAAFIFWPQGTFLDNSCGCGTLICIFVKGFNIKEHFQKANFKVQSSYFCSKFSAYFDGLLNRFGNFSILIYNVTASCLRILLRLKFNESKLHVRLLY